MKKNELIEMKKRLLAFGLAGVMIGTTGCTIINKDKNEVPEHPAISEEYSNIDDYRKYVIQNGNATKLYNSQNIYLLFNKETYEITECIYNKKDVLGGLFCAVEVYDLSSEKLLVYSDGINRMRNQTYYAYLIENNYQVCLANTSDYIEGYNNKEYYSLDEIRELEPQIAESLKIINSVKVKTK